MVSEYTINWFSNDGTVINSPELQRYFQAPIGSLDAASVQALVAALPLTTETAPILAYYSTLLRLINLIA